MAISDDETQQWFYCRIGCDFYIAQLSPPLEVWRIKGMEWLRNAFACQFHLPLASIEDAGPLRRDLYWRG